VLRAGEESDHDFGDYAASLILIADVVSIAKLNWVDRKRMTGAIIRCALVRAVVAVYKTRGMNPITADFALTFEEFAHAYRAHRSRRRFLSGEPERSPWIGCAWIAGLFVAVLIAAVIAIAVTQHPVVDASGKTTMQSTSPVTTALIAMLPWIFVIGVLWILTARSPVERRIVRPVFALLLLFFVSYSVIDALINPADKAGPQPASSGSSLLTFVPWFVLLAGLIFLIRATARRTVRVAWEGQPNLREAWHVEATAAELLVASRLMRIQYAWGAFVSYAETPELFVLFVSAIGFTPIPKRGFTSAQDIETFRAMLIERIPNANPSRQGFEVQLPPVAQHAASGRS
jgi:hypothetical protein